MTLTVNPCAVPKSILMIEELVLGVLWNDPHCTVLSYDICRRTNYLFGPTHLAIPRHVPPYFCPPEQGLFNVYATLLKPPNS
jgi:hypothetical protein